MSPPPLIGSIAQRADRRREPEPIDSFGKKRCLGLSPYPGAINIPNVSPACPHRARPAPSTQGSRCSRARFAVSGLDRMAPAWRRLGKQAEMGISRRQFDAIFDETLPSPKLRGSPVRNNRNRDRTGNDDSEVINDFQTNRSAQVFARHRSAIPRSSTGNYSTEAPGPIQILQADFRCGCPS